jgi:hypothetical protein
MSLYSVVLGVRTYVEEHVMVSGVRSGRAAYSQIESTS